VLDANRAAAALQTRGLLRIAGARRKSVRNSGELAMERARQRFIEAHRAKVLRAQIAARQEAQVMSSYLAELEAAHGDSDASLEWIEWVREYITKLDPLTAPPSMPAEPEISREDLKPFLPGGMSPYGPGRW
jgi:hypothetical protein